MADPRYKRVLLKISGEAFCKEGARGVDISEARSIAGQVCEASEQGSQVAVVVGGGNIVRGGELSQHGINEAQGDYMGMLATVINALALQDVLEQMGKATRVMTAIPVQAVAETFLRRRALRHLEKGRVVILAAGTGNPHFTTDTAAALRATELGAEVLLKASKVDGVYDSDPKKNPGATKIEHLQYLDVLNQGLGVMDMTAVTLCMEKNLPIIVFDLWKNGSITRAVRGERIGTLIDGSTASK
ncbi:MAG: UMP kinase [Planctomycetota bacterium]|nr:UMP kinase [Planctomycetota bacterium]